MNSIRNVEFESKRGPTFLCCNDANKTADGGAGILDLGLIPPPPLPPAFPDAMPHHTCHYMDMACLATLFVAC